MRAKWVSENPAPELPVVAQAIVASFWPGRFFLISTMQLDASDPLHKLTRSLQLGVSYGDVPTEPDTYITQMFKCNRDGWVKSFDNPLYHREYSTLTEARNGHKEIVALFSSGKLRLS